MRFPFYLIMVAQATMNINISFAAMVSFGFAQDRLTTHHERHAFPLTLSLSKGLQLKLRRITFSGLIRYYEINNRSEGKSPKAISWYSANLKGFRNYLKNRHFLDCLDTIDTKLLREYILYLMKKTRYENHPYTPLKQESLSTATIHGHGRTLRALFNWLEVEGLVHSNPARDLKPLKVTRKVVSTEINLHGRANSLLEQPSLYSIFRFRPL